MDQLTKKRNCRREGHEDRVDAFLEKIAEHGLVRQAAREIGISHTNHNSWLDRVPGYLERFEAAKAQAKSKNAEEVKSTFIKRALYGLEETIRDRDGNVVFDQVDEQGNLVTPDYQGTKKFAVATRRIHYQRDLEVLVKALCPELGEQINVRMQAETKTEVTHKFDYDAFARDFSAYARQRLCERGDAGASGNGN